MAILVVTIETQDQTEYRFTQSDLRYRICKQMVLRWI